MKWSKKVFAVLLVLVLCFASFSGMFFSTYGKVESVKAASLPQGKGIWIWHIWELPNNGNLANIRDKLVSNGIKWVTIKLGDSDEWWLDPGHQEYNWLLAQGYSNFSQVVSYFHEKNIQVFGWQYMYSYDRWDNPNYTEVDIANKILDVSGIDGLIIDAEGEFEGQGKGAIAESYMQAIRSRHLSSFIAYSTFARISSHTWFPYLEFGKHCDAVMPQAYWADRPTTPQDELNIMKQQWDYWQNQWVQSGHSDSVKPILPMGSVCNYSITSSQIKDFCEYAYNIGYTQAISLWKYECMSDDFWATYSQVWTPYQPPTITVSSPTNGNVWYVGETRNITWTVSGDTSRIDHFILGYSTDGGSNYKPLDPNDPNKSIAPSSARSISWIIPNTPSTQCKVIVFALDINNNLLAVDDSNGFFTIAQPTPTTYTYTFDTSPRNSYISITIDGSTYYGSSLPKSFTWQQGTSHTVSVNSTVNGSTGIRYIFNNWSDNNTSTSRTIISQANTTLTAIYNTQYSSHHF